MGMTCVTAGDDQSGLARERDTQTFDADKEKHGPISIGVDEVTDIHAGPGMDLVVTGLALKTVRRGPWRRWPECTTRYASCHAGPEPPLRLAEGCLT
jgi:hypothetical protein